MTGYIQFGEITNQTQPYPIPQIKLIILFSCTSPGGETGKNEFLADDNTAITRFEMGSLLALRSILDDFAKVSGLKCNFDKTMVMPVGTAIS